MKMDGMDLHVIHMERIVSLLVPHSAHCSPPSQQINYSIGEALLLTMKYSTIDPVPYHLIAAVV